MAEAGENGIPSPIAVRESIFSEKTISNESHAEVEASTITGSSTEPTEAVISSSDANKSGYVSVRPEFLMPRMERVKEDEPNDADIEERRASQSNKTEDQSNKSKRKRGDIKRDPNARMCLSIARGEPCATVNCAYLHDVMGYLATKPADLGPDCYNYSTYGQCTNGVMCRYGASHIDFTTGQSLLRSPEAGAVIDKKPINILKKEVQTMLRKKNYSPNLEAYPEKSFRMVDFGGKVYIAPLTTVGNLPFRRVMKDCGADITCGEMALAANLEQGQPSEWALLRRHESEECFGVQVAGSHADSMKRIARVLEHETSTDFVDLNCGCPIELVCNKGCGSALLTKPTRLLEIVASMASVLHRPLTIKLRTGWDEKNPSAHKLLPMLQQAAKGKVAAVFIHGRSRLQRYHKAANWEYILEAAQAQDASRPLIPVIGNGDILTVQDWQSHQALLRANMDDTERIGLCDCAMLARGALIKPWLPRELKAQQDIDISSSERLDILKTFVNYGLDHWGSDQQGVNNTRRFLLEWLSFLHRYVPLGVLEHTQGMQQRPPRYFGRNDLETLFASPHALDWVKISELLLGKVPEDFEFEAKHKSNSYGAEPSNG